MKPEDCLREYEAALATQDWSRVEPLVHDEIAVTFSSGEHFRGKAQVGAAFTRNFSLIEDEKYELVDVEWIDAGATHAACTYRFRWSGLIDGAPASGRGRGTTMLKNEGGRWLVLAEHLGPDAAD